MVVAVSLELRTFDPKPYYTYTDIRALLPAEKRTLLMRNEEASAETSRKLFLWLSTQAGHFLSAIETATMLFLVSRTYGYYKRAEIISRRQAVEGVWDAGTGDSLAAPPFANYNSFYRVMTALEQRGFISKVQIQINGASVGSLVEVHAGVILSNRRNRDDVMGLKVGKKHRVVAETDAEEHENAHFLGKQTVVHMRTTPPVPMCTTPPVRIGTTEERNIKKVKGSSGRSVPHDENEINFKKSAKEVIAEVAARATEKRLAKAARTATTSTLPALQDLNALWREAVIGSYGRCIVSGWTHREYGMLKRVAKVHDIGCTWKVFVEWAIRNWSSINAEAGRARAHIKKTKGDWSLESEGMLYLGTEAPDTYQFVKSFGKLLKRYAQGTMVSQVKDEETPVVAELKKKLAERTAEAIYARGMLVARDRVKAAPAPRAESAKPVHTVNPATDTFFRDTDTGLPEWN